MLETGSSYERCVYSVPGAPAVPSGGGSTCLAIIHLEILWVTNIVVAQFSRRAVRHWHLLQCYVAVYHRRLQLDL